MASSKIRVAAAQFHAGQDIEANLQKCLLMLDKAAEVNPDLVVLPEFCNHLSWYDDQQHAREVALESNGAFLSAIAERAAAHSCSARSKQCLAGVWAASPPASVGVVESSEAASDWQAVPAPELGRRRTSARKLAISVSSSG